MTITSDRWNEVLAKVDDIHSRRRNASMHSLLNRLAPTADQKPDGDDVSA